MPKNTANQHLELKTEELEKEIELIGRLLLEYKTERNGLAADAFAKDANTGLVAIARLVEGLSLQEWQRIAKHSSIERWIAFPVHDAAYPFLQELQDRLDQLVFQSDHDPLCGLYNRRAFERQFHLELDRCVREHRHLSLALIDLDDFKAINDTFGHPCGDIVLKNLAQVITAKKRTYDIAARIGGEEFALVLPTVGPLKAKTVLERLLELFRKTPQQCTGHEDFQVNFSAGIASTRGSQGCTPDVLFHLADNALYQAKKQGKNQVVSLRVQEECELTNAMVRSDEKQFLFSGEI